MNVLNKNHGMPTALFHRRYLNYQGGHGKVWDYFNHIRRSTIYRPMIYFTNDSVFDESNPWKQEKEGITKKWDPAKADLLFLAGMDWLALPDDLSESIPVINLIQGIRHADRKLPLFDFLGRRAYRICVSQEVADAILATGKVNGPVSVISNGVDLHELMSISQKAIISSPKRRLETGKQQRARIPGFVEMALTGLCKRFFTREHLVSKKEEKKIFIAAMKDSSTGTHLAHQLRKKGYNVDLLTRRIARSEFLMRLRDAWCTILLPLPREGFYLPGLEAMALGTPVIMPDCLGNREYAKNGENCLLVKHEDILGTVFQLDSVKLEQLRLDGIKTAERFSLENEFQQFSTILRDIETRLF